MRGSPTTKRRCPVPAWSDSWQQWTTDRLLIKLEQESHRWWQDRARESRRETSAASSRMQLRARSHSMIVDRRVDRIVGSIIPARRLRVRRRSLITMMLIQSIQSLFMSRGRCTAMTNQRRGWAGWDFQHAQAGRDSWSQTQTDSWVFFFFLGGKPEPWMEGFSAESVLVPSCLFVCLFKVGISTDKTVYLNRSYAKGKKKEKKEKKKSKRKKRKEEK